MILTLTSTYLALWGSLALCEPSNRNLPGDRMSDYANEDVDSLRAIAQNVGGTEHAVFLAGLADRMEQVIVDIQPVFTREDVEALNDVLGADLTDCGPRGEGYTSPIRGRSIALVEAIADRIERTLPTAVLESA